MSPHVTRKLAAIVCTDVVAYSRLMEADEDGTLSRMKAHRRELWEPEIAGHGGRIVGSAGDALMIEFASAVSAVECALAIQQGMAAREAGQPGNLQMLLRIGVNMGEVVVDGGDLLGDGVNVAARLQTLARPGGICISGKVRDEILGKLPADFADGGAHAVKNIARPVRVWRWPATGPDAEADKGRSEDLLPLPDKPSIAVLPFDNLSGDPEQDYFADGICEDVITDLSKVSGLFVTARNSSFAYKGKSPDIRRVCRELGVRHVLEGSVRRAGRRVRISAQLIDGHTGGHLWADRFDRDLEDIFAVQDDVTREIVRALEVALTRDEKARRDSRRKVDPKAYDLAIRARSSVNDLTAEGMVRARQDLESAIAIEPDLAPAHAWLALVTTVEYANGWNGAGPDNLQTALQLCARALASDENEPFAYLALALTRMWLRDLDAAERSVRQAIALDPNFAGAFAALGSILDFAGRADEAIVSLQTALRLDPEYGVAEQFLGRCLFNLGRYDEAEATYRKRLEEARHSDIARMFLASIHGHQGRNEEARHLWREIHEINPGFDIERLRRIMPYREPAVFERLYAGLRAARLIA
ncbi:adenylate/guanylate cyclase domain-containing protein [Oceanibacterium hippocampi]|uniref:DNA-binding transcriptional activator CadC n=1 Tax=Oceanibacterium hippocampi TaxID=745714 RepID=A0A1Y5T1G5_9PROT|nr:adenylate/guanylate cyclase domain-containing protein [Oceanibacterium hippocampi]SLN53772.1 DNA-binding transcriptional activator CadC [Oceanibacterium hippocampi]